MTDCKDCETKDARIEELETLHAEMLAENGNLKGEVLKLKEGVKIAGECARTCFKWMSTHAFKATDNMIKNMIKKLDEVGK